MTLHSSGPMSHGQIRGEFGGDNPVRLSQFYRGAGRVPNIGVNGNISTGGRISNGMFYGARKQIPPLQLMQIAAAHRAFFTRTNINGPANDHPDYTWANAPINTSDTVFSYDYRFDNNFNRFGDVVDQCTIIVWMSTSSAINGSGIDIIGFNTVNGPAGVNLVHRDAFSSTGDRDNTGRTSRGIIAVYHAGMDRRRITSVVVQHQNGGGSNHSNACGCIILPGLYGLGGRGFDPDWQITPNYIAEGEFIIAVGSAMWRTNSEFAAPWRDRVWAPNPNTGDSIYGGTHYENMASFAQIYGSSAGGRGYDFESTRYFNSDIGPYPYDTIYLQENGQPLSPGFQYPAPPAFSSGSHKWMGEPYPLYEVRAPANSGDSSDNGGQTVTRTSDLYRSSLHYRLVYVGG